MVLNITHFLNLENALTLELTDWLIANIFHISIDQSKDPAKSIKTLDGKDYCIDITRRKRKSEADSDGAQNEQGENVYVAKKPRVCFRFLQNNHR